MKTQQRFLALATLVMATILSACGGGDRSAEELIPDLRDLGFQVVEEGPDPFARPDQDMYRALYADPEDQNRAVVAVIYLEEDEEMARNEFAALSRALENPPPDFFGGEATQIGADPLNLGDERAAFVTAEGDQFGRRVWTDIYRSGRLVLITQVMGMWDVDQSPTRSLVAERVIDEAP
jgi:hypothetical protein